MDVYAFEGMPVKKMLVAASPSKLNQSGNDCMGIGAL